MLAAAVALTTLTTARANAPTSQYAVFGTSDEIIVDLKTGLTWQRASAPTNLTLSDAKAYCQAYNGAKGSRLPTYRELSSLLDESPRLVAQNGQLVRSYIDYNAFPDTVLAAPYWTSTPSPSPGEAGFNLTLSFSAGNASSAQIGVGVAVRCVYP